MKFDMDYETITLDVMSRTAKHAISLDMVANLEFESYVNELTNNLILSVTNKAPYYDLEILQVPKDWKEHFKERWFPKYLLKKFPIKYKEYRVTAYYRKVKLPEYHPEIVIRRMGDESDF